MAVGGYGIRGAKQPQQLQERQRRCQRESRREQIGPPGQASKGKQAGEGVVEQQVAGIAGGVNCGQVASGVLELGRVPVDSGASQQGGAINARQQGDHKNGSPPGAGFSSMSQVFYRI